MTNDELKLLIPLLEQCSQELSNNGCNDQPIANSPATLSLWKKWNQWSDPEDLDEWTLEDTTGDHLLFMDWTLIDYLIHCIQEDKIGKNNGNLVEVMKTSVELVNELTATNAKQQAEIAQLRKDSELLDALRQVGVDNWEGYGDAFALLRESDS